MEHLLEVDMTSLDVQIRTVPKNWETLGGRLLIGRLMNEQVPPRCYPLGEENAFIVAAGLLAGTNVSSCGRLSVGGKSPMNGTIKESNAGGIVARTLARLGYRAIVVHGQARSGGPYLLVISRDGAKLEAAPDLSGLRIFETNELLKQRYGGKIAVSIVGPVGEMGLPNSLVAHSDGDGRSSRMSGRGGLGAVMAAKGLKAIVYLAEEGQPVPLTDNALFKTTVKRVVEKIQTTPQTSEVWPQYGTSLMIETCNGLGALPTRNFSAGQFEGADNIGGEHLYATITGRGGAGQVGHPCMPGCMIRCSNVYPHPDGSEWVSPLEYETLGLLGPNLCIDDMDFVAEVNYLCNDFGADTMELGSTLGVMMEGGLLAFGDAEAALELVREVGQDTLMGRLLCSGAEVAGKALGVYRVPTVKGQTMAAYDPRGIKGLGVTYATSPQGADHTAGHTVRASIDKRQAEGQWEVSLNAQITMGMYDSIGGCMFFGTAIGPDWELLCDLLNARYGWQLAPDDLSEMGKEVLRVERAFNREAGFGPAHDRLPQFMETEPLPPYNEVFDVSETDLDKLAEI